jgi:hypothetical protein
MQYVDLAIPIKTEQLNGTIEITLLLTGRRLAYRLTVGLYSMSLARCWLFFAAAGQTM